MPKIRFTDISTGTKQDADAGLPLDAAPFGGSEATVRPKVFRVGSAAPIAIPPRLRTPPSIVGTPGFGQVLSLGGFDFDGDTGLNYRWFSDGVLVGTAATYTVQATDQGKTITAQIQATASGSATAWVDADAPLFIPVVILAVVLDAEWQTYEAAGRTTYARVDDNPTDGYEFCACFAPVADVSTATLTLMPAVDNHYEVTSSVPAAVGSPQNRTVQSVRIAERLVSDPSNVGLWRWVSEVKSFAISSTPTAPGFTVTQGVGSGEIILNRTAKADGSGLPVTADKYRVNGGAWVPVPGDLEIGQRILTGFTPVTSFSFEFVSENANGQGVTTAPVNVTSGSSVAPATTTTLVFNAQQVVASGSYTVVTHVDGGKCIVVPSGTVTLNTRTPAVVATPGAVRNGVMKNPQRVTQAFDQRATAIDITKLITFPVALAAGDVLVLAVSRGADVDARIALRADNVREGVVDEYDVVYVATSAPDPLSLTPAAIGWAGRASLAVPAAVDYMAKAALLPTSYGITGHAYLSAADAHRALRFNPMYALTYKTANSATDAGYERMFPWSWSNLTTNSNYGENISSQMNIWFWHLGAPLAQVPLATKAAILMRLHSFAYQTEQTWEATAATIPLDGGHQQMHQGAFALMYWMTGDTAGLDELMTKYAANWGQFFYHTEDTIPEWMTPWGDPDVPGTMASLPYPSHTFKRRVIAVDSVAKTVTLNTFAAILSGGRYGSSIKDRWGGLYLTRFSDGLAAKINDYGGNWGSGLTATFAFSLTDWPVNGNGPFAVGDIVTAQPAWTPTIGQPDWRLNDFPNTYCASMLQSYRNLNRVLPVVAFLRAMGLHRSDWQAMWDYLLLSVQSDFPTAVDDYPSLNAISGLGALVWGQYSEIIKAVPQPALPPPPVTSPFYPDVPDVDLAVDGAALKFPQGNGGTGNQTNGLLTYKAALYQTETNFPVIPSSATAQAFFAIVRLPKDKRALNASIGIIGNSGTGGSRMRLSYEANLSGDIANRSRFRGYIQGNGGSAAQPYSLEWTEDAALVVFKCDGANVWSIDWYSLLTGTKFADPTPTATATAAFSGARLTGTHFGVGVNATDFTVFTSNTGTYWPGEIEAVGMVVRNVSDADWISIAQGADIYTVLAAGTPANVPYLKQYDATTAGLITPASATADLTLNPIPVGAGVDPVTIPASWLRPGSTLRRQSAANYLTIDLLSEGWVYGLVAGDATRLVPFSGKAGGYTGNVEVRVYSASTGDVVRDWTVAGAISAGAWSGNIELPKANGWWFCEARIASAPTVKAYRRTEFAVGYKFLLVGQSQLNIAIYNGTTATPTSPQTFSFAHYELDNGTWTLRMYPIGVAVNNAMHWFSNQFRRFDPSTPFMVIDEAVNGTGMADLYNDATPSARLWSQLQDKLDAWGNDITVIAHQWATNDANQTTTTGTTNTTVFKERIDALFLGTGAAAGAHNLSAAMPDAVFAISPTTRYSGLGSGSTPQHTRARTQVCEWAHTNTATVGPPCSDVRIENGGGPHQTPAGSDVINTRMAIACARAAGVDTSQNAYFTTAAFNAGKTTITVSVGLPNGGNLFSPAPTALRSFEVQDGGAGGWVNNTFTAAIVGNTVVLTKTSGAWATGTQVAYLSGLQDRADLDGTSEDLIIAGALYETWSKDVLGKGMPVLGSLVSGDWYPDWSVTVS